jgi:hypothetical protein
MVGEYGPAATDTRHRLSMGDTLRVRWGLQFNPLLTANTGPPFDITTGRDFYGDTLFNARRSRTWFLFRDEYLFVLRNVLVAEIPQSGHATYLFAKSENLDGFLERYAELTREDIRRNRGNVAAALGFFGRVVRGRRRKRWLADVLKQAGEKASYIEAFD